jgi:hypothetical protein
MSGNYAYDKPEWRENNRTFLKRCFGKHLPGSYVELIGGHIKGKGNAEMFSLLKSAKIITKNSQFIGVDINPVVMLQRMREAPEAHPYPLVFGDVFSVIKRVQQSEGSITDILGKNRVEVDPKVVAINFDIGKRAVLDPKKDNSEWWTRNALDIRSIVRDAWGYTDRVAIIGNFTRDRGSEKGTAAEERRKFLVQSVSDCFRIQLQGNESDITASFEEYKCEKRGTMIMITARFLVRQDRIQFYDQNGNVV